VEFEMEARVTRSLLDSGRVISRAGNVAALLAGAGCLLPGSALSLWVFSLSLLCWIAGCWLAVRVAIDASLYRVFARGDSAAAGKALDGLLVRLRLRSSQRAQNLADRSPGDRCQGALRLWRCQIAAFTAQLAILVAAVIQRGWSI
jgi:hypothetical protein